SGARSYHGVVQRGERPAYAEARGERIHRRVVAVAVVRRCEVKSADRRKGRYREQQRIFGSVLCINCGIGGLGGRGDRIRGGWIKAVRLAVVALHRRRA